MRDAHARTCLHCCNSRLRATAVRRGFAVVNGFVLSAVLEMLAAKASYKAKLLQVGAA